MLMHGREAGVAMSSAPSSGLCDFFVKCYNEVFSATLS